MPYAVSARDLALDAITADRVRLHSADPGVAGTDNALGALTAAVFDAAASGERLLNADVTLTSLGASATVSHFSIWLNAGTVFRGGFAITSGDTNANVAGEYVLKATTTKMTSPPS